MPQHVTALTEAEKHLVDHSPNCALVDCWVPGHLLEQQIIRADFLRAFLLGQVDDSEGQPANSSLSALRLQHACVVGTLDLSELGGNSKLPHLTFLDCCFTGDIVLRSASLGAFRLTDCGVFGQGIHANGGHFYGAVELTRVCFVNGTALDLSQAKVVGTCSFHDIWAGNVSDDASKLLKLLGDFESQLKKRAAAHSETEQRVSSSAPPGIETQDISDYSRLANRLLPSRVATSAEDVLADKVPVLASLSLRAIQVEGDLIVAGLSITIRKNSSSQDSSRTQLANESLAVAIDAERAIVKGDVCISRTKANVSVLRGGVSLVFARISGSLRVEGVCLVRAKGVAGCCPHDAKHDRAEHGVSDQPAKTPSLDSEPEADDPGGEEALNAEGAEISGPLLIVPLYRTRPVLYGCLRILGARIHSQVLLQRVFICSSSEAIHGDGVAIDGDFFVKPSEDATPKFSSAIFGKIRLVGATIAGQLGFIDVTLHGNVKRQPTLSMGDITVDGGIFFRSDEYSNRVVGEIRFDGARVGGVFDMVDTRLLALTNRVAISAKGATLKGDFRIGPQIFPASQDKPGLCVVYGYIGLAGATIEGRLLLTGARISNDVEHWPTYVKAEQGAKAGGGKLVDDEQESVLIASGATIKGGFYARPGGGTPCRLRGALRLNNATIGSKLELKGVEISALNCKQRVALAANGAHVIGDFRLLPRDDGTPYTITGEIRLFGITIDGGLEIKGGSLQALASGSGFAIDGYNATIEMGVSFGPGKGERGKSLEIKGIVGFAFSTLGSFTFGESPRVFQKVSPQHRGASLAGHLRLNGAQILDGTFIEQAKLTSPACLEKDDAKLIGTIVRTLNEWSTVDPRTVVSAQNANLGGVFSIQLSTLSQGMIDLSSARVVTLDDVTEDGTLGWGKQPTGRGWLENLPQPKSISREARSLGKDPDWTKLKPVELFAGIKLRLSGFAYTHLMGAGDRNEKQEDDFFARHTRGKLRSWLTNAPLSPLEQRQLWLRQQYPLEQPTEETFTPLSYLQLTNVFRSQGLNQEADSISRERRKAQTAHGSLRMLDKRLQSLYGFFFGFGYSSSRALLTILALFGFNLIFSYVGANHRDASSPAPWLQQSADKPGASFINVYLASPPTPEKSAQHNEGGQETSRKGSSSTENAPCTERFIYALGQTLPLVHVVSGGGCIVPTSAPSPYKAWRIFLLFLNWIAVPTALLTFSGILRETNK